jgi:hypothetical protein
VLGTESSEDLTVTEHSQLVQSYTVTVLARASSGELTLSLSLLELAQRLTVTLSYLALAHQITLSQIF